MDITINYWVILLTAAIVFVWGMLYYGPLFGKTWMKLAGVPDKKPKMEKMMKSMALGFINNAVMAYILTYIIAFAGYTTLQEGLQAGFWVWLGFIATTSMGAVLWEGKSWKLYFLNNAYSLTALLGMGVILTLWG